MKVTIVEGDFLDQTTDGIVNPQSGHNRLLFSQRTQTMAQRKMLYIELKTNHNHRGPA